jgi:hypothetical protein
MNKMSEDQVIHNIKDVDPNDPNIKIVYVYRQYPSHKRAVKKYYEEHKDEIREYSKVYQKNRYEIDEEYREKVKRKALERYHLKKQKQQQTTVV